MGENPPALNTDRELYREGGGDGNGQSYYEPSIHVTEHGAIGINVGGHVITTSLRGWHLMATERDALVRQAKVDALRSQRDFFLAIDMDAAADHCEQAAIACEAPGPMTMRTPPMTAYACPSCGEPVEPYTYRGEQKWKHSDDMPHGHSANPNDPATRRRYACGCIDCDARCECVGDCAAARSGTQSAARMQRTCNAPDCARRSGHMGPHGGAE